MTQLRLSAADYLVVGGYFVLVLWVGFYFRNRLQGVRDYFAGGNRIPWWLAGISHYMSSFSAFAFIAYAQIGYTYGWVAVTLFWATIPGCALGGLLFAKLWRRARVVTPVEFLETRYNGFVRQLFAWAGIPMKIFDDALKIFATVLFVSLAAGIELRTCIVVCGAVMAVYTLLGGLWALVITDYIQFLMKAAAMLLLAPMAVAAAGGLAPAFRNLPPGFFSLRNGPYGWIYIAGFTITMMVSYNASWSLAQKYYSVRDEREASKAAWCAAALNFVGAPLMILPALIARNLMPELAAENRTADTYVLLVMRLLPAGMVGIIMAAMFSATMAMVSADFNAMASVLTKDVYQRLIRPAATERRLMAVGRWTTLGIGAITTLLGIVIALTRQQSLFNIMVTVLGVFMAPTFLPLLAGLAVRRLNWQGALGGFICGLGTGLTMFTLKTAGWNPFGSTYELEGISLILNAAATVAGMAAGTLLFRREDEEAARVKEFFAKLDEPIRPDEVPAAGENPAAEVLGLCSLGVGALLVVAGAISGTAMARYVDAGVGLLLILIGLRFRMRRLGKVPFLAASLLLFAAVAPAQQDQPFFFMQLGDPQLGMNDSGKGYEQEAANLEFAIATANRLRPAFVVVSGDLVNKPENELITAYMRIVSRLDASIPLYNVAGNHDVSGEPTPESLAAWRKRFGPDYYSFRERDLYGIVLNSNLIHSPGKAMAEAAAQETWLRKELETAGGAGAKHIVVFQHHSWFLADPAEPDQYFNIPLVRRRPYLDLLKSSGVRYVFAGHYHRNALGRDGPLEMITNAPVGKPLGNDPSGIRIVIVRQVGLEHRYYGLGSIPNRIDLTPGK